MPIKIFTLNHVPEDEAEEVRALLSSHDIEYYETSAGNWAISAPAIWINDEQQAAQARLLLDAYQHERAVRVKEEYVRLAQQGESRTWLDAIKDNPRQFFIYLIAIAAILYLSTAPFLNFGHF